MNGQNASLTDEKPMQNKILPSRSPFQQAQGSELVEERDLVGTGRRARDVSSEALAKEDSRLKQEKNRRARDCHALPLLNELAHARSVHWVGRDGGPSPSVA